jgi:hypothetical protein
MRRGQQQQAASPRTPFDYPHSRLPLPLLPASPINSRKQPGAHKWRAAEMEGSGSNIKRRRVSRI